MEKNPQDVPSKGHMTGPAHCRDHSRLQLATPIKKPPGNPMKTFIESIHFLEIICLMAKMNIPKKLSVSLAPFFPRIPRKSEAFEWKTKKCNQLLLLVCLKIQFTLQDLPEQVSMLLPRFKRKSMLAIHST